uniref:Saposin B-type domain-containing protein n=1 Tax=Acrobeloides nanus TaxID=290746 RepID=A0A914CRU4_9BILA
MSCTVCTNAVVYIQANPFETYSQVNSYLKNDCKSYGSYSKQCEHILNTYLPQIYDEAHHPWQTANDICNGDLKLCSDNK